VAEWPNRFDRSYWDIAELDELLQPNGGFCATDR